MDLRQRLKEETDELHKNAEQTTLLKKILLKEISLAEYQSLIQKFYGFIKPCEVRINTLACKSYLDNRGKLMLLENDLCALNFSNTQIAELPACSDLPVLFQHEHVLGYLYVMEGATLGGQVITKMLRAQLQITLDNGGCYFHGYGRETKKMWDVFCATLDSVEYGEKQDLIVSSACETFGKLNQWLENTELTVMNGSKEQV